MRVLPPIRFFALAAALLCVTSSGAAPVPPVLEWKAATAPNAAKLQANAQEIMALSEAEVLAMVPVQTPFITSDCPSCGAGHFFRGLDRKLFKFTPPGQLTCLKCGTIFPSEKFPFNERAPF